MKLLPDELCDAVADYLERENQSLAQVHRILPDGPIDDPEVAAEVERVAGWIEQIRSAPTSGDSSP